MDILLITHISLQLTSYPQLLYSIRSIASVDLLFIFFFLQTDWWISLMLQSRIKQLEDLLTGEGKIYSDQVFFLSRIRKVRSEIHLTNSRTWYQTKARNISQIFGSFCQLNSRYGLFKRFQFPAKKPRKIRAHISLSFL